jgi:hypothetical protein
MFFWFIATAVFAVLFVFRDPAFDYRLLMVGSVLPLASLLVLHSVVFSIALLTVLMLATPGRKPIRRMLLGLPVGTLLHLVFTGAWTNSKLFWWPLLGVDIGDVTHPVVARGWWNVPLELAGLAGCWWIVRRIDWRTGRIAVTPTD